MRVLIVALAIALTAPAICIAQSSGQTSPPVNGVRFVIVHSPHLQSDTTLLDTLTGRTWRLVKYTDMPDQPEAWEPLPQLNTYDDRQAFRRLHKPNPADPDQPAARAP